MNKERLTREEVLNLIDEAMQPNPESERDSDCKIIRGVTLRDPETFVGVPISTPLINKDSIQILDSFDEKSDSEWDTKNNSAAIIVFDGGMGLVTYDYWADMTFSGTTYLVDIISTQDWEKFDRACLTDELREKFKDFIAEINLLRG